jgi:hypothetical protein
MANQQPYPLATAKRTAIAEAINAAETDRCSSCRPFSRTVLSTAGVELFAAAGRTNFFNIMNNP